MGKILIYLELIFTVLSIISVIMSIIETVKKVSRFII